MILFGLRDVSSVNACLPVVQILKDKGINISIYAEGPACEKFKDKLLFISEYKVEDLLNLLKPSLVVATCANIGGSIPVILTQEAKKRGLPVVLIQEMWVGHSTVKWDVFPDGVCVYDKFARDLILKSWPNYSESRVHITGAPIFDKFVNIQEEFARNRLQEVLDLDEEWPVIFFPGQIWGMSQAVSIFIEALNGFDTPFYVILRDHPSITFTSVSDNRGQIYSEYQEILKKLRFGRVVDSTQLTGDEVIAGADIVINLYSTMAVEACYLRKPVLTIWTPEIGQSLLRLTNNTLAEWPVTNLGVSLKASNAEEVIGCLKKIMTGNIEDMKLAQEKYFKTDGLSGRRVAEAILRYY